jgi:hypothetical protein
MNDTGRFRQILTFLTVLLIGFAGLTGYHIIACGTEIDFGVKWNMFDSVLMGPLFVIGFILGLGQKFHVYEPWFRIEHSDGRVEHKRDKDIINNLEAGCIISLLQYLLLGPILIAAVIYYPLMVIVYFFGVLFPYLIAGFLIFTVVLFHKWERILMTKRSRLWSMPVVMIAFVGFLRFVYVLWVPGHDVSIEWMNPVALGVIPVTVIPFVVAGIQAKKDGHLHDAGAAVDDDFRPSTISGVFLIAYIVLLLIVFSLYGFKMASGDTS